MFGSRFGISSAAIAAVSFLAFQTNADKIQDYFGCYTDVQSERVLSDKFKLVDSTQMTTEVRTPTAVCFVRETWKIQ